MRWQATLVSAILLSIGCSSASNGRSVTSTQAFVVPYVVQGILYSPPFNKSSVSYGGRGTLGTRTRLEVTRDDGATFVADALPSAPSNGDVQISMSSDGTVITKASSAAAALDNPPICSPTDVGCDPAVMDPIHLLDELLMLFDVEGQEVDYSDGSSKFTVDFSTGEPFRFSMFELLELAQDPQDLSTFVDSSKLDIIAKFVASQDAQQLLAMDPYAADPQHIEDTIGLHPERFEPGCESAGTCVTPESVSVSQVSSGSEAVGGFPHAQANRANGTAPETGVTENVPILSAAGGASLGTLAITFDDVTAANDFASRSASIVLDNTSMCEAGSVDLWFDKTFGSFLWVTRLTNACN